MLNRVNKSSVFENLCESSLQFLDKSISNIETEPKFALLHFCTSVELFLKARLVSEHWSLVVEKNADQKTFLEGKFRSVNPFEAMARLDKICGDAVPIKSREAFSSLIEHRNSVMHFYHMAEGENIELFKNQVAKDICIGVFHFEKVLEKWSENFGDYLEKFKYSFFHARRFRTYLEASFNETLATLDKLRNEGEIISDCRSCGFEAAHHQELTENLATNACLVCKVSISSINIDCPECGSNIHYSGYDGFQVRNCTCTLLIEKDDFQGALETEHREYYEAERNCANCGTMHEIIAHQEYYICGECLEFSDHISYCEWCSEGQVGGGDLESSYYLGCEFCEGNAGWRRDD